MLDEELIDSKQIVPFVLWETIQLLADATELGDREAGDPGLAPEHRCDLCDKQATDGRVLSSSWAHTGEVRDGRLHVFPQRSPDGDPVLYWICFPCFEGVKGDQQRLWVRLLAAHLAERN
jgi:hypothetical protein